MAFVVGTGTTLGVSASTSVTNSQSMINSSLDQILSGHFTMYGSDLVIIIGSILSVWGILVTMQHTRILRKLRRDPSL